MTKNKLTDLNDHLFAELERLGDEELTGDELKEELGRAKGVATISSQIIKNANTMLSAARFFDDHMNDDIPVARKLLGVTPGESGEVPDK